MSNHTPTRLLRLTLGGAVLALALAACSGASGSPVPSADGASSPTADLPTEPVPTVTPGVGDGVPPTVINAAVADAASRAGVDPTEVTVVSAEAVTFPDGGLGCPEPGMMYTQVLTPGYRVVVEAGGTEYDYRASAKGGRVRWCESPPEG